MLRTWPTLQGVRVSELHEEHGLHVHLLTNQFIDVNTAREIALKAGWGRIHVMQMPPEHAGYVGKYLSKERPPCFNSWRLWAPSEKIGIQPKSRMSQTSRCSSSSWRCSGSITNAGRIAPMKQLYQKRLLCHLLMIRCTSLLSQK